MGFGSVILGVGGGGGSSEGWNPANKAVLEKFGQDSDGKLVWNGKEVSEPSRETSAAITLTAAMIAQGYVELPEDCDTSEGRPVIITYGSVIPEYGADWGLELHDAPTLDRIVWAGYALAALLVPDTELTVTYYKKL